MNLQKDKEIQELGSVLLEIGAMQMSAGASSGRIRNTINRIGETFGYNTELLITHRALMITLYDEDHQQFFSSLKRTSPHGVNFKIVSGISRMSWRILEENWGLDQIREELKRLASLPHYPRIIVLTFVSLAGACFCRIFGGNFLDMLIAFASTFFGLFIRQEALKMRFNPYLCVFVASFAASLFSGFFMKLHTTPTIEHAFTASVLFLIPGVPLINCFSDMIDGNILNGILRGMNGIIIAFTIALGLLASMIIYRF